MKILGSICLLMICAAAVADDKGAEKASDARGTHETADAQVLKVFNCKDGDYKFVAYEVKWKDHDVIVSDPLAKSDYHVGDTIRVLVLKSHLPNGNPEYLLSFHVMPPMPQLPLMPQIPQRMPNAQPAQPVPAT